MKDGNSSLSNKKLLEKSKLVWTLSSAHVNYFVDKRTGESSRYKWSVFNKLYPEKY